ncbi:MAG: zinc-ribbon domain-containing protein, partial [Candidatus Sulfotelmatobacter sp.]
MDAVNPMPLSCPQCSALMPDSAAFCPGCGRPMQIPVRAQAKIGILTENMAGALAYLTFIPATAFLLIEPYSKNRFVRFHCLQCLFLTLTCLLLGVALKLASLVLFLIP